MLAHVKVMHKIPPRVAAGGAAGCVGGLGSGLRGLGLASGVLVATSASAFAGICRKLHLGGHSRLFGHSPLEAQVIPRSSQILVHQEFLVDEGEDLHCGHLVLMR
jgi:hypothetical protein